MLHVCHLGILLKSGFWVSASGLKLEALHYHKLQVMLLLLLLHHVGRHLTKELQDPFYLRSWFAFRGTSFLMILLVGCSVPIANRIILGFILKVKNQYLTRDGMDKNRKGNFGLCVGNWMPLWEGKYGKTKHLWLKVMILFFFSILCYSSENYSFITWKMALVSFICYTQISILKMQKRPILFDMNKGSPLFFFNILE